MTRQLVLAHLYPDLMNIYGDRGNILTLVRRAEWRGIEVRVEEHHRGEAGSLAEADLVFFGGGQDREQALVQDDLPLKAPALRRAHESNAVMLCVCGGYQLLGESYQAADGSVMRGLGLLDLRTTAGARRSIGNVVVRAGGLAPDTLVGFENHSGRTWLGPGLRPLGTVVRGSGNNGTDGTEGVRSRNLFGTYLHGSLLPKNPHLADLMLGLALQRRYGVRELPGIDDELEWQAHHRALELAR
ncbi:MAG: type 1 glutamine amidotransferase [Candidatus Dormibacteria bacterium]